MRAILFVILILLAAPMGVLSFELLDIFVRPDRLAPLFGLDARFDAHARIGVAVVIPTFLMLSLWILLTRGAARPIAQPQLHDSGAEMRLIRSERDFWRDAVSGLLAAHQVSDADRDLLFETIRKTLEEQQKTGAQDAPKKSLVAER